MRTSAAIGIGIVCFGLGVIVTKLVHKQEAASLAKDEGKTDQRLSAMPGNIAGGTSTAGGGTGRTGAAAGIGKSARSGPLPSVEQVIGSLDLLDDQRSIQQLQGLLRGMGADDFKTLLANIDRDGVGAGRTKALQLVAQEFGKSDPQVALEFATDPKNFHLASGVIGAAVTALVRESPDEALAAVRAIGDRPSKKSAMNSLMMGLASSKPELLQSWFEDEDVKQHLFSNNWQASKVLSAMASIAPANAAAFAEKLPPGHLRNSGIAGVASAWAQRDPKAALAWAEEIENDQVRRSALSKMMGELINRDPQAAYALLDGSEGKDRKNLVSSIASGLAVRDPMKAMDWAVTLEDPEERSRALKSLAHNAASSGGVERFLGLIDELPDKERKEVGKSFVGSWVQRDPEAATEWVASIEDKKEREGHFQQLVGNLSYNEPKVAVDLIVRLGADMAGTSGWYVQNAFSQFAGRDLDGARTAAEALEDGKLKNRAIAAMVGSWANHEPESAASYVFDKYEPGPEQREMIGSVSGQWVSSDQEAALAWASGLEAADRVAATDQMISHLAWSDEHELSRELLIELLEDHPEETSKSNRLSNAIYSVMNKAGSEDPQAGIAIINQLATEDAQKNAIGSLVGSWANSEPEEARDWVAQLGTGPVRDAAAQNLVWRLAEKDGAGAFEMALSIESQEERKNSIQHAIGTWAKTDSEAARAALAEAEMSDRDRQRVLEQIE